MAVTITSVNRGSFKGDNSAGVDDAYDAFGKVNSSFTNLKTAVDLVLDLPQDTILGRITASTGDPEKLTAAQVRTLLNVADGADVPAILHNGGAPSLQTGSTALELRSLLDVDQAGTVNYTHPATHPWSIITDTPVTLSGYGISDTKANFNAALSDGSFFFSGDTLAWSSVTSTPTTLSGYGISDTKVNFNSALSDGSFFFSGDTLAWSSVTSTPTTLSGYGISDTKANFNSALSDGSFFFSGDTLAWSSVTSTPTTLSGYGISDTKANFNSALSDGTFLFDGDITGGGLTPVFKTTNYTASAGEIVYCDTTSSSITITLPASPSDQDNVAIIDAGGNAGTNKIIVGRNSETINGTALDFEIDVDWGGANFAYNGTTTDWEHQLWIGSGNTATIIDWSVTGAEDIHEDRITQLSVTQHEAALSIGWTQVTGEPTTLSGYGISDTKANFNTALSDGSFVFSGDSIAWSNITGEPTTLSGYGISDTKANFNTACSDGTFLFSGDSIAWSNITGEPTTLSGYGISDTKANFNTACSDGDFVFEGDGTEGYVDHGTSYPASNLNYTGDVEKFVANGTVTAGYAVCLSANTTGPRVVHADADNKKPVVGIALSSTTAGNAVEVLIKGVIKLTGAHYTVGSDQPAYASTTAGYITPTPSATTDDYVWVIGWGLATDVLYVNPQFNWVKVA